jgi:hypothetical protein
MVDRRNALEKHLGLSEDEYKYDHHRRHALMDRVGDALEAQDYAAAQVYALLLVAQNLEPRTNDVTLANSEELAIGIASNIAPDLHRIADQIG